MASTYTLLHLFIFGIIMFTLGGFTVGLLMVNRIKGRLNIRVYFERIPEGEYDEHRYRGES